MTKTAINGSGSMSPSVEKLSTDSEFPLAPASSDMASIITIMERLLHWAAVVESSDDAVISLSVDGLITGWNSAAERLYGYTSQEVLGKPISILMPTAKSNDFPLIMTQVKAGKKIDHYVTQRKTKEGKLIDVSIIASPIRDSQGNLIGISKIAHDISERIENERRRNEFVSIVSHELKTPIASQKIYGELLAQQIENDGQGQYKNLISKINQQTLKLEKLVNDLLELSRLHMGRIAMEPKTFDLSELITETIEPIQKIVRHKIKNNVVKGIKVNGDRDRIGQVLTNLVNNAIKYSPDADKVLINGVKNSKEIIVSVQDFGIGIDKAFKDKIFDRFFRINGEDETTYPGMGIGLNFSSEIIELHKGRMWLESVAGKGSTFYFSLPIESAVKGKG